MKNRLKLGILLNLLAFSFVLMTPITVSANGASAPPIGDTDRIEFLEIIFAAIFDNGTRTNLKSQMLFDEKVAYATVNS
ncbi:MAG: hypothetical protein ACFFD2_25210 [Promethearchaeota archaeon]